MDNNSGSSNNGEEQTVEIIIILIAGIVVFFLVVAWCGFFYGIRRNRKMVIDLSRMERHRQEQQQHRRQLLHHKQQQQKQQQQQQRNVPRQLYQQRRQQEYTPQQLQLQRQQLRQLQNASRSRLSPQLSPNISRAADFTYQQPQPNYNPPHTPYHGESISIQSGYITPAADAVPVFIPPRDYDDDLNEAAASSMSSHHSYHNRTYDYFEGSTSPNQSFTNISYQPAASYPAGAVEFNQSNVRSGYSPMVPRSTSTPMPKMQAKHNRNSQPTPYENYSMEMQQYQQLQHWPQNY